jgi:3-phenylpropionate/cinnamic acid dioxygenase small subunit
LNREDAVGTENIADSGINRRGLVGSLTKGAVAGTLLAGMGSTAIAESAMPKKGSAGASSHEQIRNLLAQYSFLLDAAKYAEWGKLFGEKGTLELNGAVWATGSEGIAKKMSDVMAANPKPITGITGDHMYRHIFTNTHITVDEASGTGEADSYFFVLHVDKGTPPTIRGGGRYSDKFARENGEWRFTAKRMDFDWSDAA